MDGQNTNTDILTQSMKVAGVNATAEDKTSLTQALDDQLKILDGDNANAPDEMTVDEHGDDSSKTPELTEAQKLEALAIKEGRRTATGLIKSARPYGFFEEPNIKPEGLRELDISVTFPIQSCMES